MSIVRFLESKIADEDTQVFVYAVAGVLLFFALVLIAQIIRVWV